MVVEKSTMRGSAWIIAVAMALALAFGAVAAEPIAFSGDASHQAQASQVKDFNFTHGAYLTKGKGAAYKSYMSYPVAVPVIHGAKISGSKLIVTGTLSVNGKIKKVSKKSYKLTKKTKYWKHVGNGSYFDKSSKAKMKKLLANKKPNVGGDINFIVKNGKVTVLSAQ